MLETKTQNSGKLVRSNPGDLVSMGVGAPNLKNEREKSLTVAKDGKHHPHSPHEIRNNSPQRLLMVLFDFVSGSN